MSTKSIRTTASHSTCDVCGRTLLRGERAEVYLSGGSRRSVCELCTSRAVHGGWVREGTVPEYGDSGPRTERRRSLLGKLRSRRDPGPSNGSADGPAELDSYDERTEPRRVPQSWSEAPARGSAQRSVGPGREPRHVRAVPTSIEHKIASAISLYNSSEHPRTVAGIARSLGLPEVSVHPADPTASIVNVVVSWELCWYRYEVDLSEEAPTVRVSGQGYELSELDPIDLEINAAIDERGRIDI